MRKARPGSKTAGLLLLLLVACSPVAPDISRATPTLTAAPTIAAADHFEWESSTPEAQRLNGSVLADYVARIRGGAYGDIHSLLVLRHGFIVTEEYFQGYGKTTLHPVYSVTKSITSGLIGIAIAQGKIRGVDDKLLTFFPEYGMFGADKQSITLEDILTMRAGLDWDESSTSYDDPRNPVVQMARSADWYKFVLDRPMVDKPGTRYQYSSGGSMLLGGVLRHATGVQAHEFAKEYLFDPLEIVDYQWETGAQGITNTGWGLHLQPRDMAKIGQLYLDHGTWRGKQIIPANWVRASTQARVPLGDGFGYGYQWRQMLLKLGSTDTGDDIKIAWGWGGQFIFVVPSLDMVIVSTAGDYQKEREGAINFIREMLNAAVG